MSDRQERVIGAAGRAAPGSHPSLAAATTVSATEAQNEFGRVLDQASRNELVVITRHNVPWAVLLSVGRYEELVGAQAARLGDLTAEFDALLAEMQRPEVKAGMIRGFQATPKEMGQAARAAARRRAGK